MRTNYGLKEIEDDLSLRAGISKQEARKIAREFIGLLGDKLSEGRVISLCEFGKLCIKERPGGRYQNRETEEIEEYPPYNRVYFYSFKPLKEKVNNDE